MSEISDKIKAYADSDGTGWDQLRDWLLYDVKYVEQKRYEDPQPEPGEQRDWDYSYIPGSFDEVRRAYLRGWLTFVQYQELTAGMRDPARTARVADAKAPAGL